MSIEDNKDLQKAYFGSDEHHTTTQKKECRHVHNHFIGECEPAPTPSINEIIKEFGEKCEYGKNQPFAIDYMDEILPQIQEWLRTTFISYRQSIYKELIDAIEGEKKEKYDWSKDGHGKNCVDGCTYCCNAEGMNVGHNIGLEKAAQIIKQKQEEV